MRRSHLAACVAVLATLISARKRLPAKPGDVNSTRLENLVTVEGIPEHQQALQNIADLNGGTRYTRTPGYTASAAYVKATLETAGLDVRYAMFNMPEWHESAPPVFQQLTPTAKTYTPGTAADDDCPAVDFITFEYSPTARSPTAPVVPTNDIVIPSPAAARHSGCEASDFPAATRGAMSLIQRGTCAFMQKLANAVDRRRDRRDPVQRGRHAGRVERAVPLGRPGYPDPGRAFELRRRQGALRRFQAGRARL